MQAPASDFCFVQSPKVSVIILKPKDSCDPWQPDNRTAFMKLFRAIICIPQRLNSSRTLQRISNERKYQFPFLFVFRVLRKITPRFMVENTAGHKFHFSISILQTSLTPSLLLYCYSPSIYFLMGGGSSTLQSLLHSISVPSSKTNKGIHKKHT